MRKGISAAVFNLIVCVLILQALFENTLLLCLPFCPARQRKLYCRGSPSEGPGRPHAGRHLDPAFRPPTTPIRQWC